MRRVRNYKKTATQGTYALLHQRHRWTQQQLLSKNAGAIEGWRREVEVAGLSRKGKTEGVCKMEPHKNQQRGRPAGVMSVMLVITRNSVTPGCAALCGKQLLSTNRRFRSASISSASVGRH